MIDNMILLIIIEEKERKKKKKYYDIGRIDNKMLWNKQNLILLEYVMVLKK